MIMMKAIKKNQIVIFAIALMLVTAGYLNYSMHDEKTAETWSKTEQKELAGIGDAKLVSNNNTYEENIIEKEDELTQNSTAQASAKPNLDNAKYFSESKLERESMYSEMLETYQSVLANSNVTSEQKINAQTEIGNINNQKNAIMIAENLIKNKGFEDVVIFVNNESVSVVVKSENLDEAAIAQIQSIVQRELSVNVENIHISNK